MLRHLSGEWLAALQEALRAGEVAGNVAAPAGRLVIGQVVTGTPGGEVRYSVAIGGALPPEVIQGSVAGAQVTLVTDHETARAVAGGSESLATALVAGRVKVRGDANALIAAEEALASLATALASLAQATSPD
ncbi:MAG TPA: hypothetical protein VMD59_10260 [Acidimicrobiales bacterium]|nr:hypothetical protein [Acidimicrobiales bacterium]